MVHDPWLNGLRGRAEFTKLREAEERHCDAATTFERMHGAALVGVKEKEVGS